MLSVIGWPLWTLIAAFIIGLVFIVKGGDFFVDAASWMAEVSGIPHFVIGATVVSLATTLPELIVSCLGAARGNNAIAIGNAVGSVSANSGLIMGILIVCMPVAVNRSRYALKSILLIAATAVLYLSCLTGGFSVIGSILLLAIFAFSIFDSIKSAKKESVSEEKTVFSKKGLAINLLKFIFGSAGIVIGADFLVSSATEIATVSGVSQAVISATIVAVGTSLPELVTTITAIAKKQSSLSVGNIIGANLIDIAIILPICSIISPDKLTVCAQNLWIDIPFCLAFVVIALVPMLIHKKFSRVQGIIMLCLYTAYIVFISVFNPFPAI